MSDQKNSDQKNAAQDIEQRYVTEHAETEELLEGLDPRDPDDEKVSDVEAVSDDAHESVERMAGET